jgi:hypothetical protein
MADTIYSTVKSYTNCVWGEAVEGYISWFTRRRGQTTYAAAKSADQDPELCSFRSGAHITSG